jgi:hypothetical protein
MNRFTWEEWILARAEKRRRDDERAMNDLGAEEPGYELFWDEKTSHFEGKGSKHCR